MIQAPVGLSKGAAEPGVVRKQRGSSDDPRSKPTLASAGIDKHLANRARKMAAIPEDKFKAHLAKEAERIKNPPKRTRKRTKPKIIDRMTVRSSLYQKRLPNS